MKTLHRFNWGTFIGAAALGALLSACGGSDGGGDAGARGLMTIDASNAEGVSSQAYQAVAGQIDSVPTDLIVTPSQAEAGMARSPQALAKKYLALYDRLQATATQDFGVSQTVFCDNNGGSIDITADAITFNACQFVNFDSSYSEINGSISRQNFVTGGSAQNCDLSTSADVAFNNFNVKEYDAGSTLIDTFSIEGGFHLALSMSTPASVCETRSEFSGTSWVFTYNSESVAFRNFSLVETLDTAGDYSISHNLTLDVSTLPGAIIFATPVAISGNTANLYPSEGEYTIADAGGVKIKVVITKHDPAAIDAIELYLDLDGDGAFDPDYNPMLLSWSEFLAL